MKPQQAKELILQEGRGEGGIMLFLRMGRDPGPVRMHGLIHAIRMLFNSMGGRYKIERDVAAALFALGTEMPAQIESWRRSGCVWREDLVQRELVRLMLAVESVFEGEWLVDDPPGAGGMTILVENCRKKLGTLERATPGALILDLTSKAEEPWVRVSPFYPHGGIRSLTRVASSPGRLRGSGKG